MTHDPWKSILLHAVKEYAEEYQQIQSKDAQSAREQVEEIAQMFLGDRPSLEIKDLHDFAYDPNPLFYLDLLRILEKTKEMELHATVARCGWIRRHGNPRSIIPLLSTIARTADVPPTLRSTAGYEVAQAHRKLRNNAQAIEWLRISAAAAEEAGSDLQSLMNQAVAASWEAETNPESADAMIRMLRDEFRTIVEDQSPNRDIAKRWVMNTTYDLAKIAAKTGRKGVLETCLDDLEKPEYRERNWITDAELQELRAAL